MNLKKEEEVVEKQDNSEPTTPNNELKINEDW